MSGQVRLRWSSHQSTVISMLDSLLAAESLVDVTLTCEGQMLHAHKVILSACSPYFEKMLSTKERADPIIFLTGVRFTELKAVINFIYRGEVNISQEDLPSFLTLAEELQIRGLANQNDANSKQIRTKILDAASKSVLPMNSKADTVSDTSANSQHNVSSSSPPPLKKARPSSTTAITTARDSAPSPVGSNSLASIDPVPSSPEALFEQLLVGQSEDEFEEDRNMGSNEANDGYDEEYKECSLTDVKMSGYGLDRSWAGKSDWTEVLAEDENSVGHFSLSDPDGWQFGEHESLEMIPDDDDDDIQEISGTSGLNRSQGSLGDNEPSLCPLCNKQFAKRKTWNTHCLYDCPMVPPKYSCPNCDYRARRGYQLKIHCLKIHGIVT